MIRYSWLSVINLDYLHLQAVDGVNMGCSSGMNGLLGAVTSCKAMTVCSPYECSSMASH